MSVVVQHQLVSDHVSPLTDLELRRKPKDTASIL